MPQSYCLLVFGSRYCVEVDETAQHLNLYEDTKRQQNAMPDFGDVMVHREK